MYNHNKAQQSKNRVHISWGILYAVIIRMEANHQSLPVKLLVNVHLDRALAKPVKTSNIF